jgi:hypothetical protein
LGLGGSSRAQHGDQQVATRRGDRIRLGVGQREKGIRLNMTGLVGGKAVARIQDGYLAKATLLIWVSSNKEN